MNYLDLLKKKNLKATPQRLGVLKILSKHEHPNIDELYEEIKKDNPTISLATVYKNLSTMINEGIVVEILIPNQKSKYDIYEYEHIHLICSNCNEVYDLSKKEAKMSEYQDILQGQTASKISNLNISAYLETCPKCNK